MKGKNSRQLNDGQDLSSYFSHRPANAVDTRLLLQALSTLNRGDFSVRLPVDWTGTAGSDESSHRDPLSPHGSR